MSAPIGQPDVGDESELKVIPSRKLQIKLLSSLRGDSSEFVIQVLTNAFQLGNYRILHTQRVPILDEYLDTNDLLLHRTKRTFRVRRRNNKLTVTTKTLKGFAAGEFHREEKTWEIDQPTYDEQLTTGFGRFRDHVKDIGQRPMSIRLKVTNERDLYIMRG